MAHSISFEFDCTCTLWQNYLIFHKVFNAPFLVIAAG